MDYLTAQLKSFLIKHQPTFYGFEARGDRCKGRQRVRIGIRPTLI